MKNKKIDKIWNTIATKVSILYKGSLRFVIGYGLRLIINDNVAMVTQQYCYHQYNELIIYISWLFEQ
jgi:hypothetical protein